MGSKWKPVRWLVAVVEVALKLTPGLGTTGKGVGIMLARSPIAHSWMAWMSRMWDAAAGLD